jgi:uncharacterized cysteine cluster protein YcgN (CxxCxxCC family)
MPADDDRYWETKRLADMTAEEWEALCDGCGRCCLVLLEDEDAPGRYDETDVCCRLFDPVARRCTRYDERQRLVPDCVQVTPANAGALSWMPKSCAYRRLAEGRGLAGWHPLVSGRAETVVEAGIAVAPDLVSERRVRARNLWRHITGRRDS